MALELPTWREFKEKFSQENWRTVEVQVVRETGLALPDFVIKEFEEYLRCGILASFTQDDSLSKGY